MNNCPKCNNRMEEGFMVDEGYGARHVLRFHPDKPDKRWWGLKVSKPKMTKVEVYRCTRCGFLEQYAKG